jgi:hypothetical protein
MTRSVSKWKPPRCTPSNVRGQPVLCLAPVTKQIAGIEGDFEENEADRTRRSLDLIAVVGCVRGTRLAGA